VLTRYVRGIDLWRPIPYLDPGLADSVLPSGWPGHDSEELFAALSLLAGDAWVRLSDDLQLVGSDDAARDAAVQH
jgi:phenylacetic acid degradation operon negative regulatory protein